MKFDVLHAKLVDMCTESPERGEVIARILKTPELISLARNNYDGISPKPFQRTVTAHVTNTISTYLKSVSSIPDTPLSEHMLHVIRCLAIYAHHSDRTVRKWATVASMIQNDEKMKMVLSNLTSCVQGDAHEGLEYIFNYVVSECVRRGAHILPFHINRS